MEAFTSGCHLGLDLSIGSLIPLLPWIRDSPACLWHRRFQSSFIPFLFSLGYFLVCVLILSNQLGLHLAFPAAIHLPVGWLCVMRTLSPWLCSTQSRASLGWLGASAMRPLNFFSEELIANFSFFRLRTLLFHEVSCQSVCLLLKPCFFP